MQWPAPVTLTGSHVRLEPLSQDHRDALIEAVSDGELWRLWYTGPPHPERMADAIAYRMQRSEIGMSRPFAVVDLTRGKAVGMTSYTKIDAETRRLDIGGTWYRKSAQRGPINTECKLLLFRHAFDDLDCVAVELRCHFLNHQSRRAIERLGAKLDGVIRSDKRMSNGTLRDTCIYSIIAAEWPAVRAHLAWELERPRT